MSTKVLLVALAGTLFVWFLQRFFPRRAETETNVSYGPSTQASSFHGVAVYPYPDCCQAAKAVNGKRFLPNDAPSLPLSGCNAEKCRCVYRHHADRRARNKDRRAIETEKNNLLNHGGINSRSGVGRREIDKNRGLSYV